MHGPLNVKKRNVILRLKEIEWVGVDRVHLAQDKNYWRALVNTYLQMVLNKQTKGTNST
jgi:hypothetical protein